MNNSIKYLFQSSDGLSIGLSQNELDNDGWKSTKRIFDNTLNPMYWSVCMHRFNLNKSYAYTDIILLNGDKRKFVIIDENGKINPKYDITSNSTASRIRLELYNLIGLSYTEFNPTGIISRILEHPYKTAEWRGTVTDKIEMTTTFQANLTPEQQLIVEQYKAEQNKIKAELDAIQDKKKQIYKDSTEFDASSDNCTNIPIISSEAHFIKSGNFYERIKLHGINLKFNTFVVTHSYIDAIKKAFTEFDSERYNVDIKWKINLTEPAYYKFGINQISDEFSKKFYIYYNDNVISNFFTKIKNNQTKLGKALAWRLYYWTIGLMYINNKLDNNTNIDDIFFYMMCFIEKYFIKNNVHAIQEVNKANKNDIKIMSIEKLISNIIDYQKEIDILEILNFIRGKSKNGCLFPDGWTDKQKREWKESNNIERKKHKERKDKGEKHMFKEEKANQSKVGMKYDKSDKNQEKIDLARQILKLQLEGKSYSDITEELKVSRGQISKILKKFSSDVIYK